LATAATIKIPYEKTAIKKTPFCFLPFFVVFPLTQPAFPISHFPTYQCTHTSPTNTPHPFPYATHFLGQLKASKLILPSTPSTLPWNPKFSLQTAMIEAGLLGRQDAIKLNSSAIFIVMASISIDSICYLVSIHSHRMMTFLSLVVFDMDILTNSRIIRSLNKRL